MRVTLGELCVAYRKAKVDLYYSSHRQVLDILLFEENLEEKLERLQQKLDVQDDSYFSSEDFLGGWTASGSKIEVTDPQGSPIDPNVVHSCPEAAWRHAIGLPNTSATATFRVMADCSVEFHVLSALWIMRVGAKLDARLGDCSKGNRLRRGENGHLNPKSLGNFKPYLQPYRQWVNDGLSAMRQGLENGRELAAVTADVKSFYHRLDPSFAIDDEFLSKLEVTLDEGDKWLHKRFIDCLSVWAAKSPAKSGLPVGLPAAAVLANVALFELDELFVDHGAVLHYGRYVDDLIFVMERPQDAADIHDIWADISSKSKGLLTLRDDRVQFEPEYLQSSEVVFENAKNKLFLLDPLGGRSLIDSICAGIKERSSEWRAFPNIGDTPDELSERLLHAIDSAGDKAIVLRRAEALSLKRSEFAILLRDLEHYDRELPPESWGAYRSVLAASFEQQIVNPKNLLKLERYLKRVLRLLVTCREWEQFGRLAQKTLRVVDTVTQKASVAVKGSKLRTAKQGREVASRWRMQLCREIVEAVVCGVSRKPTVSDQRSWAANVASIWEEVVAGLGSGKLALSTIQDLSGLNQRLFARDLASTPFRFAGYRSELRPVGFRRDVGRSFSTSCLINEFDGATQEGFQALSALMKFKGAPPVGLIFAVRPVSLLELHTLPSKPFDTDASHTLASILLATRGFVPKQPLPMFDRDWRLKIPSDDVGEAIDISVASWKTDVSSWAAAATGRKDPDLGRHLRLAQLVTRVLEAPVFPTYFVMPELSLPPRWFMSVALRLRKKDISVLAGVEYLHGRRKAVHNQVWAALSYNGLGFPSAVVYRQDKQKPARGEQRNLYDVAGKELRPEVRLVAAKWPTISHGGLELALLICSELTNIEYRARLRGRVDVLFVPEWNRDTDHFSTIVEGAAADIHAYIVQCNDRTYGDSRIRSPGKNSWERDVVRVRGGEADYFVTGRVDIGALRAFQSHHVSPEAAFKPVPDGFAIAPFRKVLPSS